jgi:hypothetical protein
MTSLCSLSCSRSSLSTHSFSERIHQAVDFLHPHFVSALHDTIYISRLRTQPIRDQLSDEPVQLYDRRIIQNVVEVVAFEISVL